MILQRHLKGFLIIALVLGSAASCRGGSSSKKGAAAPAEPPEEPKEPEPPVLPPVTDPDPDPDPDPNPDPKPKPPTPQASKAETTISGVQEGFYPLNLKNGTGASYRIYEQLGGLSVIKKTLHPTRPRMLDACVLFHGFGIPKDVQTAITKYGRTGFDLIMKTYFERSFVDALLAYCQKVLIPLQETTTTPLVNQFKETIEILDFVARDPKVETMGAFGASTSGAILTHMVARCKRGAIVDLTEDEEVIQTHLATACPKLKAVSSIGGIPMGALLPLVLLHAKNPELTESFHEAFVLTYDQINPWVNLKKLIPFQQQEPIAVPLEDLTPNGTIYTIKGEKVKLQDLDPDLTPGGLWQGMYSATASDARFDGFDDFPTGCGPRSLNAACRLYGQKIGRLYEEASLANAKKSAFASSSSKLTKYTAAVQVYGTPETLFGRSDGFAEAAPAMHICKKTVGKAIELCPVYSAGNFYNSLELIQRSLPIIEETIRRSLLTPEELAPTHP